MRAIEREKSSDTSHFDLRTSNLSWHGWQFPLPEDWSPVKIEGDWNKGSIIIADFHATRLAIRWQTAPKKFDVQKWAEQAIAAEAGQLMLKKSVPYIPQSGCIGAGTPDPRSAARVNEYIAPGHPEIEPQRSASFSAGRLFIEPEPPGRDVWVGLSLASNRLLEIVYQTKTVSRFLPDQILPDISDQSIGASMYWSIFDLSCTVPEGWTLKSQRLNAGDLTLSFAKKNAVIIVRQLAPASLALARQPLEKWLDSQQQIWKKMYRVSGKCEMQSSILARSIPRKRRFFMLRWVARERVTLATHDLERDRVVIVDAETVDQAMDVFRTVGKGAS